MNRAIDAGFQIGFYLCLVALVVLGIAAALVHLAVSPLVALGYVVTGANRFNP